MSREPTTAQAVSTVRSRTATTPSAAARMASAKPGCGLDWSLLAGIGRVESNHGYKHVKWVSRIMWVHDFAEYGDGRGGTREDSALQAFNGRI